MSCVCRLGGGGFELHTVRGRMAWHGFRLRGSGLYENDPGRNDGKQDDVRYCLLFSQCCNFNQVCGVAEAHDGQSWEPSIIFWGSLLPSSYVTLSDCSALWVSMGWFDDGLFFLHSFVWFRLLHGCWEMSHAVLT